MEICLFSLRSHPKIIEGKSADRIDTGYNQLHLANPCMAYAALVADFSCEKQMTIR